MKHKISILLLMCLQTGCAVELRDRDKPPDEKPFTELVVEKEYTLPETLIKSEQVVLKYDRLVLGPKAKFITRGLNVRLEVKELISKDGEILTLKPDQKASNGENGRRGGDLEVIVGSATGNLTITLQGEQGSDGLAGKGADESLRGSKGSAGRDAAYAYNESMGHQYCTQFAGNGKPGGQGLPGYPGGDGFNGGDSGTASVRIENAVDFHLNVQKLPGQGGQGGRGGPGGEGGIGGDPGKGDFDPSRGNPVAGAKGPQGEEGPAGHQGTMGNNERACLQMGNEVPECS